MWCTHRHTNTHNTSTPHAPQHTHTHTHTHKNTATNTHTHTQTTHAHTHTNHTHTQTHTHTHTENGHLDAHIVGIGSWCRVQTCVSEFHIIRGLHTDAFRIQREHHTSACTSISQWTQTGERETHTHTQTHNTYTCTLCHQHTHTHNVHTHTPTHSVINTRIHRLHMCTQPYKLGERRARVHTHTHTPAQAHVASTPECLHLTHATPPRTNTLTLPSAGSQWQSIVWVAVVCSVLVVPARVAYRFAQGEQHNTIGGGGETVWGATPVFMDLVQMGCLAGTRCSSSCMLQQSVVRCCAIWWTSGDRGLLSCPRQLVRAEPEACCCVVEKPPSERCLGLRPTVDLLYPRVLRPQHFIGSWSRVLTGGLGRG